MWVVNATFLVRFQKTYNQQDTIEANQTRQARFKIRLTYHTTFKEFFLRPTCTFVHAEHGSVEQILMKNDKIRKTQMRHFQFLFKHRATLET